MKTLLLTVFAFSLTTASAADLSSEFQTTSRDTEFAELMAKLNLNAESIKLAYKDGGTSVGLKIDRGDEKFGKWLPRNSAGNPELQVVSYQLGRFLGMSELVMPSAYYKLDGTALSIFKKLLQGAAGKKPLAPRKPRYQPGRHRSEPLGDHGRIYTRP